ncbi:YggS family pyridoxal phosphate-dependent enzyme [Thiomicrorhabdus sp.]|uniref:YggS family pyridoxal phosphate-dependent enzyme n=1 Tax=Thiomicrorhabdus sp. TaxID=2039724 RepID=UPI0029C7CB0E|nr:YggS family pyridoxal phosphate-dependent enzyme [Thiomicrorhabdus sp.]
MGEHLLTNLKNVESRIEQACISAGRDRETVALLAVSKTKPAEDVAVLASAGQKAFGENYLQEALDKIRVLPELEWHFIGPIQSNKTRPIAENFSWVHSVDRLKIAERLSQQRPEMLGNLNILLEINVSEEVSKSGFSIREMPEIIPKIAALPNLTLRGFMAIPAPASDLEMQRIPLHKMQKLLKEMQQAFPELPLDTLSMGMSSDLEAAILEGATIVRIGTDLFGARTYKKKPE